MVLPDRALAYPSQSAVLSLPPHPRTLLNETNLQRIAPLYTLFAHTTLTACVAITLTWHTAVTLIHESFLRFIANQQAGSCPDLKRHATSAIPLSARSSPTPFVRYLLGCTRHGVLPFQRSLIFGISFFHAITCTTSVNWTRNIIGK